MNTTCEILIGFLRIGEIQYMYIQTARTEQYILFTIFITKTELHCRVFVFATTSVVSFY